MRTTSLLLAIALLSTSCAERSPMFASAERVQPTKPYALPNEVEDFVSDRDLCDHLRGEIPEPGASGTDAPTIEDINQSCAGTDKRLELLRKKYANDSRVIAALNVYDWPIEAK